MNKAAKQIYEFGSFVLDPGERQLRQGGARMELPPRAFDTLLVLVENNGRLLEKDALMRSVWGDTVVEENNLSQVIYLLRKALRDGEEDARYIETVPKRGYRFVAEVREIEAVGGNGEGRSGIDESNPASDPTPSAEWNPTLAQRTRKNGAPTSHGALTSSKSEGDSRPAPGTVANGVEKPGRNSVVSRGWLQGVGGGLAIVAVVALLHGVGWKQRLFGNPEPGPIRSVAVLPLQNLSDDPNQEYFVDGMTDELITALAQIHELKVVSKTSVMRYKGTRTPMPQIGQELGVDAVVEGSVLLSGNRVRITAQLIRTSTDRHIWAQAYDGDIKDVFTLQARVAEAITSQVKLNLTTDESNRSQP